MLHRNKKVENTQASKALDFPEEIILNYLFNLDISSVDVRKIKNLRKKNTFFQERIDGYLINISNKNIDSKEAYLLDKKRAKEKFLSSFFDQKSILESDNENAEEGAKPSIGNLLKFVHRKPRKTKSQKQNKSENKMAIIIDVRTEKRYKVHLKDIVRTRKSRLKLVQIGDDLVDTPYSVLMKAKLKPQRRNFAKVGSIKKAKQRIKY